MYKFDDTNQVSIPHRYGKNLLITAFSTEELWFPFLIGTVRTRYVLILQCDFCAVSIPHRYGKNIYSPPMIFLKKGAFPFLIGTVRTQRKKNKGGENP